MNQSNHAGWAFVALVTVVLISVTTCVSVEKWADVERARIEAEAGHAN